MVDLKMGPTPTFFPPPYTVDYPSSHHHINLNHSSTTAPSSSAACLHSAASVGDLSRYLNAPADLGSYWPVAATDFSSCRCDAYYLGGETAVTPTRGGGGSRASHPVSPSPTSSRTLAAQRTNRSARTATSPTTANGAGDVVVATTSTTAASTNTTPNTNTSSSNARGAQFTIIANVPYDTVRQDLVSEFRKFGRVELAMVVCDEASRHPHKEWTSTAGYAFVRFSKRSEAAAAIQAATMGLITIRGTRVRADWARKDSYAKRGRVSPAQGAPSLNPLGVPDGITLLQDSLNRAAARNQWSMYGDLSSYSATDDCNNKQSNSHLQLASNTPAPSNTERWHCSANNSNNSNNKATDLDSPSSNDQAYQVLEDIVQALELIDTHQNHQPHPSSSVYQNKTSNSDIIRRNKEEPLTLPTHNSSDSWSYCNRVPMGGPGHKDCQGAGDEETTASSSAGVVPAAITQELASALSPASRGLLTVALSDVAARDAFTDVSPMAHEPPMTNHARHHFNSPEELLHQTMQHISAAEAAPPTSAVTSNRKAGPLGASTASDFSSLSEIEDLACSEGSLTPPM